jgi:hypothetical protein
MDDTPASGEDLIAAALDSLGIEADETELAVMAGVDQVFGPSIRQLVEFDVSSVPRERNLDLSRAPVPEEG